MADHSTIILCIDKNNTCRLTNLIQNANNYDMISEIKLIIDYDNSLRHVMLKMPSPEVAMTDGAPESTPIFP